MHATWLGRLLAGLLIISLILAGCASQQATQHKAGGPATIRLSEVVHSVFYTPLYVALNKGFFQEENLNIEMSTAWGGDKAMTALVADQADIGLIGPETIIYTLQQGLDKKILCFAQLTQRDGSFLVGRPGQGFSWEGLQGKTIIGARKGGVPEMVLEYVLKQKGLKPLEDVKIIQNIQFTATAGAFQAGTGDYVALFEPTVSELEQAGAGQVVASLGVESGKIPYTVFMTSEDYINKNREAVLAFTRAIYRAQQWTVSQSVDEITDTILPSFQGSERAVVRKAVERYHQQESWAADPRMQPGGLDYLQSIIESAGELKQRIPEETMIRKDIAEEVMRAAGR
ncbi:ABC transporter substrate-binding protein [Heliobacterium undosum]|uniref:ABC transporter substrate-binding protein n=1 Tax=Heliomicrobium undosum TaxID=121734 RepID=A0A845L042_9FIRM|nr:ABC transporter substrate-binding protein [Heliomicrobium undosum]MZP28225.1 ABC transporter substrate-binding protein [Heliomicrobium undosum]